MSSSEGPKGGGYEAAITELRVASLVALARRLGLEHGSFEEARRLATEVKSDQALFRLITPFQRLRRDGGLRGVFGILRRWFEGE